MVKNGIISLFIFLNLPLSLNAACIQPPSGISAWWPLDETDGTVAGELIHNRSGTHHNDPTPSAGVVGNSLSFDGIEDYLLVPNNPTLNMGNGDFSINAWIRHNGVIVTDANIVEKNYSDRPSIGFVIRKGFRLYLNQSGEPVLELSTGGGASFVGCSDPLAFGSPMPCINFVSGVSVADDQWHHLVVTVDRDDPEGCKFYLDGTLRKSLDPTTHRFVINNFSPLTIGSSFRGNIDEPALFNRALTAAEISAIYQAGEDGLCKIGLASTARLVNLSTRAYVGKGLNNVITGFAISGTGKKKLIIRAIGQGLSSAGIATALNPIVQNYTYPARALIFSNDDWQSSNGTATTELETFSLSPPHIQDAATIVELPGGVYTAEMAPINSTGIGLVEFFEAPDSSAHARLINISARAYVGEGLQKKIIGFAIEGTGTLKLALRAIGQGLVAAGVTTALNATLKLYHVLNLATGNRELIAENDDWQTGDSASELQNFGIAPNHDSDAALIVDLPEGIYTLELEPLNKFGIGLVEIFETVRF